MISYLHTAKAPSATGLYSQAVKAGDFLFISGQLPIDPKNNRMLGADIRQQTATGIEEYNKRYPIESRFRLDAARQN